MKKGKLDIPTDWARPWIDLGEGHWVLFSIHILHWKKYRRPRAKFSIYGLARGHYTRIWYGKKVIHYRFKLYRIKAGE